MKRLPCFLATTACLLGVGPALVRADVINFSNLSTDNYNNPPQADIPNGYAGFDWHNFNSLNVHNVPSATPSGYQYADTDTASPSVAFNLYGKRASLTSTTDFSFYGAFFTAAWRDGLHIDVKGYRDGKLVYDKKFTVNSTGPTFESFDFQNIDALDFKSWGGTVHGWVPGKPLSHPPLTQFAIDDLIFIPSVSGPSANLAGVVVNSLPTPADPAPEPAGLVLFAVGGAVVAVGAWGRRRFAAD